MLGSSRAFWGAGLLLATWNLFLFFSFRKHANFVRHSFQCGIVKLDRCILVGSGLLFVQKKNGTRRFVLDARRASRCFRKEPLGSNSSNAAVSELRVTTSKVLGTSQFGGKDLFYCLSLPAKLQTNIFRCAGGQCFLAAVAGPVCSLEKVCGVAGTVFPVLQVLCRGFPGRLFWQPAPKPSTRTRSSWCMPTMEFT